MKRRSQKELQKSMDAFNHANPIGVPVIRYKLMNPLRDGEPTVTTSEAWIMGGHSVMVAVKGVSGGVSIDSVIPQRNH